MFERKITDPEKKLTFTIFEGEDFERQNPIEKHAAAVIGISMSLDRTALKAKKIPGPPEITERILFKRAIEFWNEEYKRLMAVEVPKALFQLLETNKRDDQIKALKGLTLTSDQLTSFIFKAYNDFGYTNSQYSAEFPQTGLDVSELPSVVHVTDKEVEVVGKTNLSEGQLKQAVDHRKMTISKFLDSEDKWHCFFLTFRSLKGSETSYKDGTPHLHYMSNTWGLERNEVLKQLKRKVYKLPSLPHIDFILHNHETEEKNKKPTYNN